MSLERKTKKELIKEIQELKKRVAELELAEAQLKQAEETLQETNRTLATLNAISLAVSSARTPEELSESLAHKLRRVMPVDAFFIDVFYPDSYEVVKTWCFDTIDGKFQRVPQFSQFFNREMSPIGDAIFEYKEPVLIHRKPEEMELDAELFNRFGDTSRASASLLYVPLISGEEVIGLLSVQSYTFNAYTQNDVELLKRVARQIAPAVEGILLQHRLIQSNAELRESQHRYQTLYESAPVVYLSVDTNGVIKRANKATEQFTGYSLEELQGMKVFELCAEESKAKARELFERFLRGEKWKNEEIVYRRKDGRKAYGLLSVSPIKDEKGNVVESCSVIVDITERKRAEIERLTLARLGVKLVEADTLESIAILLSEATEELFHWDAFYFAERIPGTDLLRRVYAVDTIKGKRVVLKADEKSAEWYPGFKPLLDGKPFVLNREKEDMLPFDRFGDKSRPSMSLLFVPLTFEDGVFGIFSVQSYQPNRYGEQDLALLKSLGDIVAPALYRLQAERALREEKEKAEKYFDVAGVIMVVLNTQGEVTLINKRGCEILGFPEEEIIGKDWCINFIPERVRDEVRGAFNKLISGEVEPVEYYENPILTKQGEERIIAWHNTILKDREDNIVGVLSSGEDLTEIRRAEEELKRVHEVYRSAIENAQGVPYILNYATGFYEVMGKGIEALTGIPPSEFTRERLKSLQKELIISDPKYSTLSMTEYVEAFLRGEIGQYKVDIKLVTPRGEEKWLSDCAVNVRDEKTGEVTHSVGILQDITERKRAEEELKRVHEVYRRAIENAQGVPYILNYDTNTYEFFGEGSLELLGIPPKELVHHQIIEDLIKEIIITDPEAPADFFEYIKAFQRGEIDKYQADLKIVTPAGEEKWVSDCSVPIRDKDTGRVIGSLGILQDITGRKRAEEELKRIHEVYRRAIENAQGVPYILNYATGFYEVKGKGIEALTGIPASEFTREKLMSLQKELIISDPKYSTLSMTEYVDAFLRGEIEQYRVDLKIITPQGEEKWLSDCAVNVRDEKTGKVTHSLGILQDITERKRAEEELKRVHEIYRRAIENAQGVPYILNYATDTYEFFGEGSLELLGIPPQEITHKQKIKSLIKEVVVTDPEVPSDYVEYAEAVRTGRYPRYRADLRIITPQGEEKWLSDSTINITDENTGEVVGSLGILQDITARKRIEQELAQRAKELERSNIELERFAYIASHDLQEPLRKIQSFGERLKDICADKLTDEGRDYLTRMLNASERMRRLIQDLLAFSRVTTQTREFVPVNLQKLIQEVISDLEVVIQETEAQVEVAELPTIEADPTLMRQLFQNLLGNSLKFRRPEVKPHIRIYSQPLEKKEEERFGKEKVKYYHIFVEDNGIGFDEKYLDRIFLPFQRLYGRGEYEGTGMGLAICKKIVEYHKGEITAKSKPGEGAKFIVTLPVHQ